MSAVLEEPIYKPETYDYPIVIIGTGPVGIRFAEETLKRDSLAHIIIYGNEPWEPYNRVRLSSLLTGELSLSSIHNTLKLQPENRVVQHHNCEVTNIDPEKKIVTDRLGRKQPYRLLVLALGSSPHIPNIEGIDKEGVFTFRNLSDAEQLMARRTRSRNAVVLGGGLLGLEAARGMQKYHTDVFVVEHSTHLMSKQLDSQASEFLLNNLESKSVKAILGDSIKCVQGEDKVTGILCQSGREIACDTLIVATGIRSNIQLARNAGISVGLGIRVNDKMQTSDPSIYAIGECAEHNGQVYGLVAPGFEQASIAAHSILGGITHYSGSLTGTRLKVAGASVFSMGRTGVDEPATQLIKYIFKDQKKGVYRKILLDRGRLVGAIAFGDWPEISRIQETIRTRRFIWPWQRKNFLNNGFVWKESESDSVRTWPAAATICQCTGVTRGELSAAIIAGHDTIETLSEETGASSVCGSCKPLLANLVGTKELEPEKGSSILTWSGISGFIVALIIIFSPVIPYVNSVQSSVQWDMLWRDSFYKQVTGFSLLGTGLFISLISLRKRSRRFNVGDFSTWRFIHITIGVMATFILITHTGFRLGNNLNFLLMLCFTGLLLVGSIASAVIGSQHMMHRNTARQTREISLWLHIALLFPLPGLLAFHILKTYWY